MGACFSTFYASKSQRNALTYSALMSCTQKPGPFCRSSSCHWCWNNYCNSGKKMRWQTLAFMCADILSFITVWFNKTLKLEMTSHYTQYFSKIINFASPSCICPGVFCLIFDRDVAAHRYFVFGVKIFVRICPD